MSIQFDPNANHALQQTNYQNDDSQATNTANQEQSKAQQRTPISCV